MLKFLIFIGSSLFIGIKGLNMCTSTDNLINYTYHGLRLVNHIIVRYLAVTFMTCGQNCLRRSACNSFNYNIQNGTCELNYVDVQMGISEAAAGYIVTDIQNWTQVRLLMN
ncbi:hypothetical protein SNE40_001106 [Patella caerulea]|uniref:Apple domain-containing protein n=1 Tax=Patella caerulea TaxID=87958 RepID=A0AAN8QAT2_PATCE